jgi:hypothetical protein
MKKWMISVLSALFVAGLVSVPMGCGPGEAEKIEATGEAKQPPGHKAAAEKIGKKPDDATTE